MRADRRYGHSFTKCYPTFQPTPRRGRGRAGAVAGPPPHRPAAGEGWAGSTRWGAPFDDGEETRSPRPPPPLPPHHHPSVATPPSLWRPRAVSPSVHRLATARRGSPQRRLATGAGSPHRRERRRCGLVGGGVPASSVYARDVLTDGLCGTRLCVCGSDSNLASSVECNRSRSLRRDRRRSRSPSSLCTAGAPPTVHPSWQGSGVRCCSPPLRAKGRRRFNRVA